MCKAKEYSEYLLQTFNKIETDFNELSKELKQVSMYEQDLLHILENGGFNASEGYKLAKLLSVNRQKRRNIKNELEPLMSLKQDFIDININKLNNVDKYINDREQTLNHLTENKIYRPRIMQSTDVKLATTNTTISTTNSKPNNIKSMRHKKTNQHINSYMNIDNNIIYAKFKNGTKGLVKLKDVVDFDETKRVENYN